MIVEENKVINENNLHGSLDRFIILNDSNSGHCCFEYSILDTEKIDEAWPEKYESICETFDIHSAKTICNALNGRANK